LFFIDLKKGTLQTKRFSMGVEKNGGKDLEEI
jgi:hypothetical protein